MSCRLGFVGHQRKTILCGNIEKGVKSTVGIYSVGTGQLLEATDLWLTLGCVQLFEGHLALPLLTTAYPWCLEGTL